MLTSTHSSTHNTASSERVAGCSRGGMKTITELPNFSRLTLHPLGAEFESGFQHRENPQHQLLVLFMRKADRVSCWGREKHRGRDASVCSNANHTTMPLKVEIASLENRHSLQQGYRSRNFWGKLRESGERHDPCLHWSLV